MTAQITNCPPSFHSICSRSQLRRPAPSPPPGPPCTTLRRRTLHPRLRRRSCPFWRSTTKASRTRGIHPPMTDSRSAVPQTATALSWPKIGKATSHWVRATTTTFLRIRAPVSGSSLAQAVFLSNVGLCSIRRRIRRSVDPFFCKTLTGRTGEWRLPPGDLQQGHHDHHPSDLCRRRRRSARRRGRQRLQHWCDRPEWLRLLDGTCRRPR